HNGLRTGETGLAEDQIKVGCSFDAPLAAAAKAVDDVALALANALHFGANLGCVHAVIVAATREVSDTTARNHRFGGCATFVDACPSNVVGFDESCAPAHSRERGGQRCTPLSGADNDGVVVVG